MKRDGRFRVTGGGFTLVELLVVISIIALLVAILLPALAKARAAGQLSVCGSNSRQLGVAIYTYGNDFRQYMPGANWRSSSFDPNLATGTNTGWYPANWALEAKDYIGAGTATTVAQANERAKMMQCPATFALNGNMSYGMNFLVAGKANTSQWKYSRKGPYRLDSSFVTRYSSRLALGGESTYNNQFTSTPSSHGSGMNSIKTLHEGVVASGGMAGRFAPSRLHLDTRNYLLADGHVEGLRYTGKRFAMGEGSDNAAFINKTLWGRDSAEGGIAVWLGTGGEPADF